MSTVRRSVVGGRDQLWLAAHATEAIAGCRPVRASPYLTLMHHAPVESFSAYTESLPVQQRGTLLLVLWVNSVLTLSLYAAQLAVTSRALRRAARGGRPVATVLECATSPSTAAVLSVSVLHKLARECFLRQLDRRIHAAQTANQAC
jgi:hypothetical protein